MYVPITQVFLIGYSAIASLCWESLMPDRKHLLFVHFGDEQVRGSERCLLELLRGIDRDEFFVAFWCNQKSLADLAAPHADQVDQFDFAPPFGFNYSRGLWWSARSWMALARHGQVLVRRTAPAVIFCSSGAPSQWMVPVSLLKRIPLVSHLHTEYLPRSRVLSMAYAADHLIGVSAYTLRSYWRDGFPEARTSVVYNGVADPQMDSGKRKNVRIGLGVPDGNFVIVSVAALVPWKKVELAIEALRLLCAMPGPEATLLVVGDGPCMQELRVRAQGLPVVFCGWRNDVSELIAAADCLIALAEKEACPLSVLEAAAVGVATVGAEAGGLVEIIEEQVSGMLFEPGSAVSCAQALQELRADPSRCQAMGLGARAAYEKRFRAERMVPDILAIIRKYCAASEHAAGSGLARLVRLLRLGIRASAARLVASGPD